MHETAAAASATGKANALRDGVNALLVRWHRWSADPRLSIDMDMRQFDEIVAGLKPYLRIALIMEARNLACGHAVWSSARAGNRRTRTEARYKLHRSLLPDQAKWFGREIVQYNQRGNRLGESNPRAVLTDHEVDLLREMREQKKDDGTRKYSLGWLAMRFGIPKATVQSWCDGRRRAQTPAAVREVQRVA